MAMRENHFKKDQNQIMDYTTSMFVSIDFMGTILYANPSFVHTLGYEKILANQRSIWSLISNKDKESWNNIITAARQETRLQQKEVVLLTKEGKSLILLGTFHLLKNTDGMNFGITAFLRLNPGENHLMDLALSEMKSGELDNQVMDHRELLSGDLFTMLDDQTSPMNRFLDSINDLIFFKDINGVYRGCNQVFSNLLNVPKNQIIGKNDWELYPDEIAESFLTMDENIKRDTLPRKVEGWVISPDGKKSYVETLKTLYMDDHGNILGYLGVSRDITDRINAEKRIADNELWLNLYFDQSLNGKFFMMLSKPLKIEIQDSLSRSKIKEILEDIRIKRVNRAMLDIYGASEHDFLDKNPGVLPFLNPEKTLVEFPILLNQGYHHHLSKVKKLNGEYIWISGDYTCLYNEEGLLFGFYGNHMDVTKEIEAEEKLKAQDMYLRKIIETTGDGYYVVDLNLKFIDVNEAYCKMSGYPKEEILKLTIPDLMVPELRDGFEEKTKKIIESGSERYESKHIRKDGSIFDVEISVATLGPPNKFFIAFIRDITERKQLESFYLLEKELFKNTLLSAADGVISTDLDGNILLLNSMAETMTLWTQQEAKGKSLNEIMKIVDKSGHKVENLALEALDSLKTVDLHDDHQFINRHGQKFFVTLSASPIIGDGDSPRGVVIIFKDTSLQRKMMKNYEDLSYRDSLTNVYNRRYLDDLFKKSSVNLGLPLTVMVLDVNNLKVINDAFGHIMGDKLIRKVADICLSTTNKGDMVCRSGGDEFVIILPNTDVNQAEVLRKKIISKVSKTHVSSVTISLAIGYAVMKNENDHFHTVFQEADYEMYQNKVKFGKEMKLRTIDQLIEKLNQKYHESLVHNEQVSAYALEFATVLNMNEEKKKDLKMAGRLHDIGKAMLTPKALKKSEEVPSSKKSNQIKKHVVIGYQLLKGIEEYAHLAEIILYHHERFDGTGYPKGLKGEQIPLESRMIAIANFYELMTGERSYRETVTKEEATELLITLKGTQFDPELVDIFIEKVIRGNYG